MRTRRRLTYIISLLLSGVALAAILLIGVLWIRFEIRRSQEDSQRLRAEYISGREASLRLETNRICDYIEAQRQTSEIQFLKTLRTQVYEAYNLAGALASSPSAPDNLERTQKLILSAIGGLGAQRAHGRYHVSAFSGQQLLSPLDYGPGPDDGFQWSGSNWAADPAAFDELAGNLLRAKEGFFRYSAAQGLRGSDGGDHGDSQVVYLKLFEPYNWIIGTGEYLEDRAAGAKAEMLDWASTIALPEETGLMILSWNGDLLYHPDPALQESNIFSAGALPDIVKASAAVIRGAKDRGEDFLYYQVRDPETGEPGARMAFYRAIPAWNWVVVTWVYLKDLEDELDARDTLLFHNLRRQVTDIALLSVTLLVGAFLLSRFLARRADRSFSAFFAFFEQAADTSTQISVDDQPFAEFARLAVAANDMILQRKRATDLLKESELKFKTIFDLSPQVIVMCDPGGRLLAANNEFQRFSLLKADAALGRPLPDSLPLGDWESLWRLLKAEGAVAGREITALVPGDASRSRSLLAFGKIIHLPSADFVLIVLTEITALKDAEREKLILQEKLSRSTKMEAMGLMAAEVAHDLNNILSGIIGYPQLLLMEPNITEKQKESLSEILDTGQRAAAVVQDLVTIARGVASAKTSLSVNELVTAYAASPECKKLLDLFPAVRLELDLSPQAGNLTGSSIHLSKVIMNLVSNAFEAFPQERSDGRIVLQTARAELDPGRALPGCPDRPRPGPYVRLTVRDNGPGIPSQDMGQIFEPFYSKKDKGRSGTGLGLAIVWNTIVDHQGYITAESGPGGTVFQLYFQATAEPAAARPSGRKGLEEFQGRGERILVVDDVDIQRKLASKMLKTLGYDPVAVPSGEAAVEFLKKEDVDLVILDMIMHPGINGRETYSRIMDFKPRQKAIIASGMAETEEVAQAQALGAGQFVNKPYTIEDLAVAVKKALSD